MQGSPDLLTTDWWVALAGGIRRHQATFQRQVSPTAWPLLVLLTHAMLQRRQMGGPTQRRGGR